MHRCCPAASVGVCAPVALLLQIILFYSDQPVCTDLFCHREESHIFEVHSFSQLTVTAASAEVNEYFCYLREYYPCVPSCFSPDTAKRSNVISHPVTAWKKGRALAFPSQVCLQLCELQ